MVTAASNQAIAVLVARLDALLSTRNQHRNYRIIHLQIEATEDLRAIKVRQQIQDIPALPAIQGPSTQGFRVKQTPTHDPPNNPAAQAQSPSESGLSDGTGAQDFSILLEGEEDDVPLEGSRAAWLDIEKEILRHADAVFVTADSAGHRAAMLCHANIVIIDEVSQLQDHQVVNATARHTTSGAHPGQGMLSQGRPEPTYTVPADGKEALARVTCRPNRKPVNDAISLQHLNITNLSAQRPDNPATLCNNYGMR
ncbi:MAG: hypothetical protein LQ344_002617 [Seirophora lacunosa]|nr:MAG: hypothetical protein LQ344_002617 [Seirophora lacunosa]